MTLTYQEITPSDKEVITPITQKSDRQNCDLSFANLCSWRFLYHTEYALADGILVFRFRSGEEINYMMPVGEGDLKSVFETLLNECETGGYPFLMRGICEQHLPLLEQLMPGRLAFSTDRNYHDYIYLRTDLAALKGKRFQPKRNHVNKFLKTYSDWSYVPITPERIPECLEMERQWCIANNCEQQEGLGNERQAVVYALNHFEKLGLTGGILRVNEKTVAFTFGMPINENTFGVHVEKADSNIEGAYAVINQQFARHIPEQYTYLNREEDLGIEGLRKAKLSYQPVLILAKYTATLKAYE